MRLLVVGGSGFLGRNIIRRASMSDCEVAAVYWRSKDFPEWARRRNCKPIRHNLLSKTRRWSADACIYVAGNADPIASVKYPLRDLQQNVIALHRFLQGYRGGFVFMSSAAVYEGHAGLVSPKTCIHPKTPYMISKRACESYLGHFAARRQLDWATVLRLYHAYGPHDRNQRLVPRLVHAALSDAKAFTLTAPKGALLDPIFAEDVARAAVAAARGCGENKVFDLCGGVPRSPRALVRQAISSQGWKLQLVYRPRSGEVPFRFFSDPGPARKSLRLGSLTSFEEGLNRYMRWRMAGGG